MTSQPVQRAAPVIAATDANGDRTTQTYSVQVGETRRTACGRSSGATQRVEWAYDAKGKKAWESVNGTLVRRFLSGGLGSLLEQEKQEKIWRVEWNRRWWLAEE